MAVDEALLESAGETGVPALRFYSWSEPTLSLGYFQRMADRQLHLPSIDCALVRRATGGGAILHDQEFTYSLAIPANLPAAKIPEALYDLVHLALIEVLKVRDVDAFICEGADSTKAERFLCFERRAKGDVLLDGWKIGGSAQRRHKSAVLQHGSILLAKSRYSPELPGILEVGGRSIDPSELTTQLFTRLGQLLGFHWVENSLAPESLSRAFQICQEKFANPSWNLRR